MIIRNKTKHVILTKNALFLQTLSAKTTGLIGTSDEISAMFKTRFGIHTFGMRRAIDVLILDKHNRVVTMRRNLVPNRIFLWNPRYDYVLELPEGTIHKTKTALRDQLLLADD